MAQILPISLSGDNLGQRHRYLNSLVEQAVSDAIVFQDIEELPEETPVDRLFKIDLGNKLENVDYILKNIKNDDMLYVSRALKNKWLLTRRDVVNPKYLEDILYPQMVMPAISKMKHWLYINLHDPTMCQEFYLYYKDTKFDYAVKFLNQCDNEFVLNEFPKILTKITPHYLKVLGEKCPKLVKIYYDSLATNTELVNQYLKQEQTFYNNIKCILKMEPDIFLDLTEKYYSLKTWNKLSSSATEYILRFHKSRFMAKQELYVVYLLHMPTVARCLSIQECQDIVIKLAAADYLNWWFSYANVEPLVKRVTRDKRAAFKKRVFVEKNVGKHIAEWPYTLPASPVRDCIGSGEPHVFHDKVFDTITICLKPKCMKRIVKKKKGPKVDSCMIISECCQEMSELQKLFDEFRVIGFEGTLNELKSRIFATSSADRRRDMLLVLISKSGGRADAVEALLQLALKLRNDPVHARAAVIRSLAKRACVWRLPQHVWDTMLVYAHDLEINGNKSEADCIEGLHAVVMRQLIASGDCEPAVRTAFLDNFTTFTEYKLFKSERLKIVEGLQHMLVTAAADANADEAANYLNQLLNVLETYHIRIESSPALAAIKTLAERDFESATSLLTRLYEARVGRRELLRQYLKIWQDDAALLNALRHDPEAITPTWFVELLAGAKIQCKRFLLKLAVYYTEKGGSAEQIRQLLLNTIAENPNVNLAQPLAILGGSDMSKILHEQDEAHGGHTKFTAALRANIHYARPVPDVFALGWRKAGLKAIAWRTMRCRPAEVTQIAQYLLEERVKRTMRLTLALAPRTNCTADIFETAMTMRPLAALRAALLYYRHLGDAGDPRIWNIVKPILSITSLHRCTGLRHIISKIERVPNIIKPDYSAMLYLNLENSYVVTESYVLRELMKCLSEINEDLLETILLKILVQMDDLNRMSYPAMIIRYLLLSKNDNELKTRWDQIGESFFVKIDAYRGCDKPGMTNFFIKNWNQIISSLQYNLVFFDSKYECCITVFERLLTWMQTFMPKEQHFKEYVKIHAIMTYYRAVRLSIKQNPEVFENPKRKMCEGVEIVGFTFGRHIAKEVAELISQYFDSVIEMYRVALVDYLNGCFEFSSVREMFTAAIAKGILAENMSKEARLAVHVLRECHRNTESPVGKEIKELIMKSEDKETQFFLHAEIFAN